ncbi:MAG: signal transduction histidine kinase [Myxococcota bacterium]|jgi:signal transduction histidine kinase
MTDQGITENSDFSTEEEKCSLLKKSIKSINNPAFLCVIEPENPNFLEIIECNDLFFECFGLNKFEVLGNNYDFLLQDHDIDYGSDHYFEHANLIKAVTSLQISDVKVTIPHPKNKEKIEEFTVRFMPSRYKTTSIYCIFSFEKLQLKTNKNQYSDARINGLERSIKNERLLRTIGGLIAANPNLKKIAGEIVKSICEYLKVDRCILYNCSKSESGFLIEYCTYGVGKISKVNDIDNPLSPISRYIEFQNQLFLAVNDLKQTTTITSDADVQSDLRYKSIEDITRKFGIGSQIVVNMVSDDKIIGGFYLQQSSKRNWLLEEGELVEIIANQFLTAIDRSNYTHKLLVSNKELLKKRNQLAKALKQEKQMRELQSEFVALVSHEFKTPLQIIDGARELVSRKLKSANFSDSVIVKSLDRIKSAIFRMNNLIQSNLNLSKMEIGEGGIKVIKAEFEIKDLIKEIVEKNSNATRDKNIEILMDIDNMPDIYSGDKKLLDHSLTNTIVNAVKYSRIDSKINIFGDVKDNNVFLKIIDGGIGIPEDDLGKIGKKFFRAKNTLSIAGTGIGLYLTKYFVELHNGSVLIDSQLNVGTSITILLPIFDKNA